jgi:hypothetical protein
MSLSQSCRLAPPLARVCALAIGLLGAAPPGPARGQSGRSSSPAAQAPSPSDAEQQDPVEVCLENHAQGQEFRLSSKLLEARESFLHCSSTRCPSQIQRECLNYLEQIQIQIPSIVFRVSADGVTRGDVKVFVDGRLMLEKLTGKALDLNPGSHALRVVLPPYRPNEQSLIVSEGERFRVVEVAFSMAAAPSTPALAAAGKQREPEMHRPIPASSYIFGSVGAAALINGVAWGMSSWSLRNELEAGCAPRCSEKSVDVLRQRSMIADVSWGVGAASLIAAGVFYLIRPEVPREGSVDVGMTWLNDHGAIGTISVSAF